MARPVGSINKRSSYIRTIVESALGGKSIPQKLIELMEEGDAEFKAGILTGLLPYCYPKLASTEVYLSDENDAGNAQLDAALDEIKRLRETK